MLPSDEHQFSFGFVSLPQLSLEGIDPFPVILEEGLIIGHLRDARGLSDPFGPYGEFEHVVTLLEVFVQQRDITDDTDLGVAAQTRL